VQQTVTETRDGRQTDEETRKFQALFASGVRTAEICARLLNRLNHGVLQRVFTAIMRNLHTRLA